MALLRTVPLAELYCEDETAWLEQMSDLIRQRRLAELDLDNLSEYLSDMARRARGEVKSRLRTLMADLLTWQFQPERQSGSALATIISERQELADLAGRGVLRNHAEAVLSESYANAVELAVVATGLAADTFPANCPYTVGQLLATDIFLKDEG
jgi:hypothetical protein